MSFVYSVFDKVAERVVYVCSAPNDGLAIRENVAGLARAGVPLGDLEFRKVAEIDDLSCAVKAYEAYEVVSWDCYKFPESPIKPLPKDTQIHHVPTVPLSDK